MELIIDFDSIEDVSKRKFLLDTLKVLNIKYQANERPPTLVEFSFEHSEEENKDKESD